MTTTTPEVVRTVTVPLPVDDAFRIFTEQFDLIKPREHNLMQVPVARTVMEVRPGGRILDEAEDGTQCVWGEVIAVEPPDLLRFAWLIGPDWQVQDRENASEVEVRFTPDGDGTLVSLRHFRLEQHGPGWQSMPEALGGDGGWPLYLARFAQLAGASAEV
jgi:uncharacterized protein YndB with AHSA1/START domain